MRRITLWALSTLTTLVLLFSYHTSTSRTAAPAAASVVAQASAANGGSSPTPTPSSTPSSTPTSTPSSSSTSSSAGSSATKTYDGAAVSTQYGDVQVQITVKDGTITAARVLQVPWNDHRDQEINSYAVPILNSEVVSAQNATIDMVSGATFTSEGYIQSLQSAIDKAHL